jgi:hypothetical protein
MKNKQYKKNMVQLIQPNHILNKKIKINYKNRIV